MSSQDKGSMPSVEQYSLLELLNNLFSTFLLVGKKKRYFRTSSVTKQVFFLYLFLFTFTKIRCSLHMITIK